MRKAFGKTFVLLLILIFNFNFIILAEVNSPEVSGRCAVVMDANTQEIFYAKNIDESVFPASTTKLLTALLLAENKAKTDFLTYSSNAKKQVSSSYSLNISDIKVNDTMSAANAMDALLLRSCNDIATMIAENISGSEEEFAKLMNKKAKELNMNNSNFITPNGLDDNIENHKSTAYDMALLMSACYKNPWVKESLNKKTSTVCTTGTKPVMIHTTNKNLGQDNCLGGKTGFTDKAKRCLVSIYNIKGKDIIISLLGSPTDFPKDEVIFKDSFSLASYGSTAVKKSLIKKDSILDTVTLTYGNEKLNIANKTFYMPIKIIEDFKSYTTLDSKIEISMENIYPLDIRNDTIVGFANINIKGYSEKIPLYPAVDMSELHKDMYLTYFVTSYLNIFNQLRVTK